LSGRVDLRGGPVPDVGTVGTILAGISAGTVEVGTIVAVADVATIGYIGTVGTIASPVTVGPVPSVATVGTVLGGNVFGTVVEERLSGRVSIWLNGSVVGAFVGTLDMEMWDSVSVDVVVGTITPSGSLLVSVVGIEPLLGKQTSTIVASDWLVNNTSQRVTATDALGETLAVVGSITGTVVGLTVTAQRKT
jgi:hypothetical protein